MYAKELLQTIAKHREELIEAILSKNTLKAQELHIRLQNLYACINPESMIECLKDEEDEVNAA